MDAKLKTQNLNLKWAANNLAEDAFKDKKEIISQISGISVNLGSRKHNNNQESP